jgi:hypothetical protein
MSGLRPQMSRREALESMINVFVRGNSNYKNGKSPERCHDREEFFPDVNNSSYTHKKTLHESVNGYAVDLHITD